MVTVPKLMADGATGKVAIYTIDDSNPSDRGPLDAPLSYLDRLLFHSDLDYPVITAKYTGSITFPSRAAGLDDNVYAHTLFAHGLGGQPLCFGRFTNLSAQPVPIAGSVPVQASIYGFARWINLGADSTNVILTETVCCHRLAGFGAITLDWEVWLSNMLLDSASTIPTPTSEMLYIDDNDFRAGGGKFDATRRYIRSAPSGKEFVLVQGKSTEMRSTSDPVNASYWRYSVDGYAQQHTHFDGGLSGAVAAITFSFTASTKPAKTE